MRVDETIGSVEYDNLIYGSYPPVETFSVELKAGQGVLKRGSLLAVGADNLELISSTTTGKANCVLAEDVDTGSSDSVRGIAYRTGHFNANNLIVGEEYTITAEDKESLRSVGILLSDAVTV